MKTAKEKLKEFSPNRQAKIKKRTAELIADEIARMKTDKQRGLRKDFYNHS